MTSQPVEKKTNNVFALYKGMIYAVTQGRFILIKHEEKAAISSEGILYKEIIISQKEDVHKARLVIKGLLADNNLPKQKLMHILLCISEAATNILKHANKGTVQIRKLDKGVRVIFQDRGAGMEFENLPKILFLQGYSTKDSLGYGFSIIRSFSDQAYLATSKRGTFLALDFIMA